MSAEDSSSSPGLPARDQHHLRAAEGWLGLGDWRSANDELESITAALRAHPDVLAMRWQVYSEAKHWELRPGWWPRRCATSHLTT